MEELALLGGKPAWKKNVPAWPIHGEEEKQAVLSVLESGKWWRGPGNQIQAFEEELAAFHHAQYALSVTNGSHALEIALRCAGIGTGDEVIIPALTFIATANAVFQCGALPVPVDIDESNFCIDPDAVEKAVNTKTRAILPVHLGGHIADIDRLSIIARQHQLIIVEDAAHAQGAEWKNQGLGKNGNLICFSFQGGKTITAGEGGAILCPDQTTWEQLFLLHNCGRRGFRSYFEYETITSNYRMTEFQAAILRVQLKRMTLQMQKREKSACYLDAFLQQCEGITPQTRDSRVTRHGYYYYIFRYDRTFFYDLPRSKFIEALVAEGIQATIIYPPVYGVQYFREQHFYKGIHAEGLLERINCPVTDQLTSELVVLPHFYLLEEEEDLYNIILAIKKIKHFARELVK